MTGETPPSTRRAARGRRRGAVLFVRDILVIVLAAVVISAGVKAFLIRSFYIPSGSMKDTLQIDDRIVVNELVPGIMPLERGDVVVFADPGGWLRDTPLAPPPANPIVAGVDGFLTLIGLSASDTDGHLIKRVIGLPGDTVTCCDADGRVEVNGVPLHEPYLLLPDGAASSEISFDVTVPEGGLWVMGDNRDNSRDSRYNTDTPSGGFVPIDDVVGRAFVITWPIDRWSWLGNHPDTFDPVEAAG